MKSHDVVQGPSFLAAVPASFAGRSSGKPSTLTVYEVFDKDWYSYFRGAPIKAFAHRAVERMVLQLAYSSVVAISEFTAARVKQCGVDPELVEIIPCGIDYDFWDEKLASADTARRKFSITGRFVYCAFGRAGISKGFDHLLTAAEKFARIAPDSRLVLVLNQGELFDRLVRRIRDSPILREHVILLSALKREELRDVIASSDVVVVPSLSEGFGLAVAEACAMGAPVIACKVGAIPEVVSGRHILVPPRDPAALVGALLHARDGIWTSIPEKYFKWSTTAAMYESLFLKKLTTRNGNVEGPA